MRKLFLLLTFFATALTQAQTGTPVFKLTDQIRQDPGVKVGKLPNGMMYYIRKNVKPEKKAQLRLVVNTGSVLEDADQQGLAHFMEHMNFNGSTNFPKNELVNYLQSIGVKFGADLNASTSFDETIYILPIPTDDPAKVEKGFTVLEDWAGNALLDPEEINKERGVVLEESRIGKGAGERMSKKYLPVIFNGSAYATRLPIGKDSILQNFSPDALRRFYQDWYRPDLMAVVVVGDIDPAEAEKKIVEHFSKFKNPSKARVRPSIIPIKERKSNLAMVLTDKEQAQKVLQIIHSFKKSEKVKTWNDYRKVVIESLYSDMLNQRIAEITKSKEPPFVIGGAGSISFLRGYKANASFALLGDKPVDKAIEAFATTYGSAKKYGFLQSELDRAKSNLMTSVERASADKDKTESAVFVQTYIGNYLSGSNMISFDDKLEFMKAYLPGITIAEINKYAAGEDLTTGQFAILMGPENAKSNLPTDAQLLSMIDNAGKLPVVAYTEKSVGGSLIDKGPVAGKIVSESKNDKLKTTNLTLSNGVTVTLKPTDFKNDEILMDAMRPGGFSNFPLENKMNAEAGASMVMEMGVKDLTPVDLEKFLAGKAVSVLPYINMYDEGIEGNSSIKDLETFFQLIYLYFTAPRKDEGLFKAEIAKQKSYVQNMMADPGTYFQDTLTRLRYNNNPWMPVIDKPSDYDVMSADKVLAVYNKIFGNADGMHFTFVGNIDSVKFRSLLEKYIASLPASPTTHKYTDVGLRPAMGVIDAKIKKGEDQKSQVVIRFSGNAEYSQTEAIKLRALSEVITLRVIDQLRESMGGIYGGGANSSLSNVPYGSYTIATSFPCGPENAEKLTKAVFGIYEDLRKNGCEQKELDKVKETWKNQYHEQVKQNEFWLMTLSNDKVRGLDPEWTLQYESVVNALTIDDVKTAANKYLDMKNYLIGTLYPESK
ncbi:M16 family metallopeptidase [Pollutibacter soli]|uniref:M16 family metallopeptidase n=1 Tax=Pollutibacter soli TaxID=3034157 RepID=UPI0030132D0D